MLRRGHSRRTRWVLLLSVLATGFSFHVSYSAFVVDNFREGVGNQIGVGSPLPSTASVNVTGLSTGNTVGGSRYYELTEQVGSSGIVTARTEDILGIIQRFVYTSDALAIASGLLSYGRFADLNANFDQNGLITGFTLQGFAADQPAQSGWMSLTVYSPTGQGTVTKSIADLISSPQWLHEEFDGNSIDFSDVSRLDFAWGGFATGGADFNINFSIGTVNGLPEPGTMSMLVLALGVILLARKRTRVTPEPVPVRVSGPFTMMNSMSSSSDLYSLPNRSF